MAAEDHQITSATAVLAGHNMVNTKPSTSKDRAESTGTGVFPEKSSVIDDSATISAPSSDIIGDARAAYPMETTAVQSKNVNVTSGVVTTGVSGTTAAGQKSTEVVEQPENPKEALPSVVAEPMTKVKQEPTATRAREISPVPQKPEDDEGTESEGEETDLDLTYDDSEDQDELKGRVDAVVKGFGKPYDPLSEARPNLPAYHPSFSKAESLCVQLLGDAAQLLKNSEYKDVKILDLYDQAVAKQAIIYPNPRRIGLVGDSGVGKSSLINSLLDTPELALQGEDGSACTCVITEFHQAWPTQIAPFKAEIDLFSLEQIKAILKGHFQAYYRHESQSKKGLDSEALDDLETHATTAFDAFQALFADHHEFQTETSARQFLSRASSELDSHILQKLFCWIELLLSKNGAKDGVIHLTAHTAADLMHEMEPFVKTNPNLVDEDDPRPSPWPIVKLVRVAFQSSLLERGLIIADLPGLSDVNKIRTKATNLYIRKCNYVLLIAPIARVQTDDRVHKRLVDYSRAFGPQKALICTKIDDMPTNARPATLAPTAEALEQHSRLLRAYTIAGAKKTDLTRVLKQTKGKARKDMQNRINKLGLRRKIFGVLMHETLIVMRNQKVSVAMRKKYKSLTSTLHPLNIFCVSNQDYTAHKGGYDEDDIPLSLTTTGIPKLRFMLSTMPAEIRLGVLRQYFQGTVPTLVNSLGMWSHRGTTQRRSEIREVVDKPCQAVADVVKSHIEELKLKLDECILEKIRGSLAIWIEHGIQTFSPWDKWHPATFNSWIRNNGVHKSKTKGYYNWNSELLEPVANEMSDVWRSFDRAIEEVNEKFSNSLIALLEGIRETLKTMPGVVTEPMVPFFESLAPTKFKLESIVKDFADEIDIVSHNTKLDVITDEDDSYIMQALLPLYVECNGNTGKGSYKVKRTLLKHAIDHGEPYTKLCERVKNAIESELQIKRTALLLNVQDVFDSVINDFDEMFVVEEIPDPRRDALCQQIQEFVLQAKTRLDGPIAREFAAATCLSTP